MDRVGRYHLKRSLGRGGMAEVFEAEAAGDDGFRRRVAVKRMHDAAVGDPSFARMFLDEARIASQLHHACIVAVLDYGVADGAPFQVLEFVDGLDAHQLRARAVAAGVGLPVEVALYITAAVAHALSHAHDACDAAGRPLGIVHRDVSPSNVLVSWTGDVKLTDFGIAIAHDRAEKTRDGVTKGKLAYMSPEQATAGALDGRADVFALGCTLHALVAGRSPLAGDGVFMHFLASGELPLAAALPADVRAIVSRATAAVRGARYATAGAMAEALGDALARRITTDARTHVHRWLDAVRPRAAPVRGALDALLDLDLVLGGGTDGVRSFRSEPSAAQRAEPMPAEGAAPVTDAEEPPPAALPARAPVAAPLASVRTRSRAWSVGVAAVVLVAAVGVALRIRAHAAPSAAPARVVDERPSVPPVLPDPPGPVAPPAPGVPVASPQQPPVPIAVIPPVGRTDAAVATGRRSSHAPPAVTPPAAAVALPPVPGDLAPGVLVVGGAGAQRAEILIDGVSRGYAPRTLTLPAGRHSLRLVRADGTTLGPEALELSSRNTPSNPLRRIYP